MKGDVNCDGWCKSESGGCRIPQGRRYSKVEGKCVQYFTCKWGDKGKETEGKVTVTYALEFDAFIQHKGVVAHLIILMSISYQFTMKGFHCRDPG